MALTKEQMLAAIERSKVLIAENNAKLAAKKAAEEQKRIDTLGIKIAAPIVAAAHVVASGGFNWNTEQQTAIDYVEYGKSCCLIGAAGTGKTTTLKGALLNALAKHRIPPLEVSTKYLAQGAPGVALISYTRRAVRNITKQMPPELRSHCITFHKLVEYEPQYYSEWDEEKGEDVNKMRFAPARNAYNPLPRNLKLIIVDEASMLSIDYFNELLEALPEPSQVQFVFLGDLNQLPPVYGQAILGKMLLELPIIELTRVYRQALESPIISLALAVKDNNFDTFTKECHDKTFAVETQEVVFGPKIIKTKTVIQRADRGKVTLHPWKKSLDKDDALHAMQQQLGLWITDGTYDPDQDLVLCPWNKSFGADELNLAIADKISKIGNKKVWEVIAGFNKYYFAIGDKLLIDKQEAIILGIKVNPRYMGKLPQPASTTLNRWGNGGTGTHADMFDGGVNNEDIDLMLLHASDVEDRTTEASHELKVLMLDSDLKVDISKSAALNNATFAYAMTVHKAQGSECRRVFFLTHGCHAAMCSRELVYTAITRAAEELYIVMEPALLGKAASKPRIKGDTLASKLEFFASRMAEKED